ncbi:hypothetical protein ACFY5D_19765 [Paeniglutamicibacter sp. NPDC012692]|uniref:hypothetical protein n=1 Tax=Paeniglutamicibacter sp. NPDC012692 TaxID=3364388 RepID=UPI0036B4CD07
METESLIELAMTLLVLLVFGFVGLSLRSLSTGRLGRNSLIGIRTKAVTHCDRCWLLGHHAAAAKTNIGLVAGAAVLVVPAVAGFFVDIPDAVHRGSLLASLAILVAGLLLGVRDAQWVTSKIHKKAPAAEA